MTSLYSQQVRTQVSVDTNAGGWMGRGEGIGQGNHRANRAKVPEGPLAWSSLLYFCSGPLSLKLYQNKT